MSKTVTIKLLSVCFYLIYSQIIYSQVFTVSDGKLYDANNEEFIIRGVNHPHNWFIKDSYKALDRLAELNVNCVRIVWQSNGKAKGLRGRR